MWMMKLWNLPGIRICCDASGHTDENQCEFNKRDGVYTVTRITKDSTPNVICSDKGNKMRTESEETVLR